MMTIKDVFSENLKYISQMQIDTNLITQQFNGMDKIITADPLCYLASNECCPELEKEISPGQYPIDIAIVKKRGNTH